MGEERVLSCIQPTGELHLGNYLGAIKAWVELQDSFSCIYGIVDYHAMTAKAYDPATLGKRTLDMAIDLIACGIDPDRSILFVQSHIPEHTELCWILCTVSSYGALTRMTQFKSRSKEVEFVSAGLFNYPVLQAADILIYKAHKVPVGRDQQQHIELCREIAARFNKRFGTVFPLPEALFTKSPKLKSFADPSKKMSKSYGPKHYVYLTEPKDSIERKIMKAVTDPGPKKGAEYMSPGVENLFTVLSALNPPLATHLEMQYREGTLQYEKLKKAVFESVMEELEPIRQRRSELAKDPGTVLATLKTGTHRAREIAQATMEEVRRHIGVILF